MQSRGPGRSLSHPHHFFPLRLGQANCRVTSDLPCPLSILRPHPRNSRRPPAVLVNMYYCCPTSISLRPAPSSSCDGFMLLLPSPSPGGSPGCSPCLKFASTYHGTVCVTLTLPCFNCNPTSDPPSSICTCHLALSPSVLGLSTPLIFPISPWASWHRHCKQAHCIKSLGRGGDKPRP